MARPHLPAVGFEMRAHGVGICSELSRFVCQLENAFRLLFIEQNELDFFLSWTHRQKKVPQWLHNFSCSSQFHKRLWPQKSLGAVSSLAVVTFAKSTNLWRLPSTNLNYLSHRRRGSVLCFVEWPQQRKNAPGIQNLPTHAGIHSGTKSARGEGGTGSAKFHLPLIGFCSLRPDLYRSSGIVELENPTGFGTGTHPAGTKWMWSGRRRLW